MDRGRNTGKQRVSGGTVPEVSFGMSIFQVRNFGVGQFHQHNFSSCLYVLPLIL